jgi:hypothetical protein
MTTMEEAIRKRREELAGDVIDCHIFRKEGYKSCFWGDKCTCAEFQRVTQHFLEGENELVDVLRNTFPELKSL